MEARTNAEISALLLPFFIIMICLLVSLKLEWSTSLRCLSTTVSKDRHAGGRGGYVSYNGMPPQQIEADITNTFERFFTLGANIDHSESRSLTGARA